MDVGWFIAEACLALGMIGTVTGFLLMLSGAFADIDLANTSTIQKSLTQMALGMSTALYTTLVGLICSLTLKVQLMNVENENQRHEA
jgi:biopolymer transport protein ExbB/TolQ